MGTGIAIGAGVGVALGVALDSIPLGIALGMGMGVTPGATLGTTNEDDQIRISRRRTPLLVIGLLFGTLLLGTLAYFRRLSR